MKQTSVTIKLEPKDVVTLDFGDGKIIEACMGENGKGKLFYDNGQSETRGFTLEKNLVQFELE